MLKHLSVALCSAVLLNACGGGSGSSASSSVTQGTSTGAKGSTPAVPAAAASGAIALFTARGAQANGFVATGDVFSDTLGFMNGKRAELGLPPLAYSSAVSQASANHAFYMQDNSQIVHDETVGAPGFTGVTPAARVALYYQTNSVGEIAAGFGGAFASSTEPIEALFDAPFHRTIVTYDVATAGIGAALTTAPARYSALDVNFVDYQAFVPDTRLIAYPYSEQTGVKTAWVANESPNPMANAPAYIGQVVGYPVTLSAAGAGAFSNVAFGIVDAQGRSVPCQESDDSNTADAVRMATCVPFVPLATNTVYTVTVSGSLTNSSLPVPVPFSVTWSFATTAVATVPIGAPSNASGGVSKRQLPAPERAVILD
jgi:uncharacterized protein YkwD